MDDDIKTLLIGAYQALQQHEKQMLELKISVESVIQVLKQKDDSFASAFEQQQRDISRGLNSMSERTGRSYDAIIARLKKP